MRQLVYTEFAINNSAYNSLIVLISTFIFIIIIITIIIAIIIIIIIIITISELKY